MTTSKTPPALDPSQVAGKGRPSLPVGARPASYPAALPGRIAEPERFPAFGLDAALSGPVWVISRLMPPCWRRAREYAALRRCAEDGHWPETPPELLTKPLRVGTTGGSSTGPQLHLRSERGAVGPGSPAATADSLASALPIGHPGCCLDRRRERALLCLPPVVEGLSWTSPSRRW